MFTEKPDNRYEHGQRGASIAMVLGILLVGTMLGSYMLRNAKTELTSSHHYWERIQAKSAAETGFAWILEAMNRTPSGLLLTHSDSDTPYSSCDSLDVSKLPDMGGGEVTLEDGWIKRTASGEESFAGNVQNETVRVRSWMEDSATLMVESQVEINGRTGLKATYTLTLLKIDNYTFLSNGDLDANWRRGSFVQGKVHTNGNLYLSGQEVGTDSILYDGGSITAGGKIHVYRNSGQDHILAKQQYINDNKVAFYEAAAGWNWPANFTSHLASGRVFVKVAGVYQEMFRNGPTDSYDSDNPTWKEVIEPQFKGVVQDGAPLVTIPMVDTATLSGENPCADEVLRLNDVSGVANDVIFNSAYGHYEPLVLEVNANDEDRYRYPRKAHNQHESMSKLVSGINKVTHPTFKVWLGGWKSGRWINVKKIDLSDPKFYPSSENGGILDGDSSNLYIYNASKLLKDITIHTFGEVYLSGDFNVGKNTDGNMDFTGRIGNPASPAYMDTSNIKNAAVIANENRIWFLSFKWHQDQYGHGSASPKRGRANMLERDPFKDGIRGGADACAGAYVGTFVQGVPNINESFYLKNSSHGSTDFMSPNILENWEANLMLWGTELRLNNGTVSTAGPYGDGTDLFTQDNVNGYLKPYAGKIPPRYGRTFRSMGVHLRTYENEPPGFKKEFQLSGVKFQ